MLGFEAGDELVGLVEDDADVEVDDGDVDADGVGLAVGILDFGLCSGRRGGGGFVGGSFFFLEDDAGVVGCRPAVVGGWLLGGGLLLRGWRSGLGVSAQGRKEEEQAAKRRMRAGW